jgi:hypothetical protein
VPRFFEHCQSSLTFVEVGDVVPTLEPMPLCKRIVALGDHPWIAFPSFRASASNDATGPDIIGQYTILKIEYHTIRINTCGRPTTCFVNLRRNRKNLFLNKLTFSERVSTIMLGDSRRHMRPGALGFAAGRCVKAAFSLARRHSLIGGAIGGRFWGGQWNTLGVEVHHFGCDGHGG